MATANLSAADAAAAAAPVPDIIKQFVVYLYRHIRERNVPEIASMVDISFSRLTERLYRSTPWPPAQAVSPLVDGDAVFLLLYKELTYRHLHACCAGSVTLEDRAASWDNYRVLFDIVLSGALNVRLPASWLWDVVDEFCYQFQAYHQAKSRAEASLAAEPSAASGAGAAQRASPADAEALSGPAGQAWPASGVATYLSALAEKAGLDDAALATPAGAAAFAACDGGSGPDGRGSNVLRLLGLFARLGLARVRCCLGDYEGSLSALGPALNPMATTGAASAQGGEPSASTTSALLSSVVPNKNLYTSKVAGAHVCLHYYCGFSYLMLGRYVDAARCLDVALSYVSKVKQSHARSQGYDALLKKNEQCAALLALVLAMSPGAAGPGGVAAAGAGAGGGSGGWGVWGGGGGGAAAASSSRLSDAAASALREKHADKISRMLRSPTDASWEDLFAYGCPKFVPTSSGGAGDDAPGAAAGGAGANNASQAAYRAQLRSFLESVASKRHLPPLRQLLRIYTKASLTKIASLMNSAAAAAAADAAAEGSQAAAAAESPITLEELREALIQLRDAQTCVTWVGGGGPETGVALPGAAVDVEIELSKDEATGDEIVEVVSSTSGDAADAAAAAEVAATEALAKQVDAISGVVRDLEALPPIAV